MWCGVLCCAAFVFVCVCLYVKAFRCVLCTSLYFVSSFISLFIMHRLNSSLRAR